MPDYYEAPCLDVLEAELNKAHPDRDRRSDGWIGDASHAARPSDHNPDWADGGVVRARDIDKDGPYMPGLLRLLIADNRTNYVIWRGYIYSRIRNFRPVKYNGVNGHFEHIHLSIRHGKQYENDTRPWGYHALKPTTPKEDEMELKDVVGTNPATGKPNTVQNALQISQHYSFRAWQEVVAQRTTIKALTGAIAALSKGEKFDEQKLLDSITESVRTATAEAIVDAGASLNALQAEPMVTDMEPQEVQIPVTAAQADNSEEK